MNISNCLIIHWSSRSPEALNINLQNCKNIILKNVLGDKLCCYSDLFKKSGGESVNESGKESGKNVEKMWKNN